MTTRSRLNMVLLCACLVPACGGRQAESPPEAAETHDDEHEDGGARVVRLSEEAFARATLQLASVERTPLDALVLAPAALGVDVDRTASVGPRVAGRVSSIAANVGDRVRQGGLLATIESSAVAAAQADAAAAAAAEEVARRNYERERRLLARRISAQRDVLAAEAELARAVAMKKGAQGRLQALGLEQDAPGNRIALRSPIAGTVIERGAVLGGPVTETDVLFRVADLGSLWLIAKVPETELRRVRRGQPVTISVDALPDTQAEGRVSYIAETVDPATRAVDVRVVVPNRDGRLKPGMFARARIATGASANHTAGPLTIPRAAVQQLAGKPVVFVKTGDREFTARDVVLGETTGDRVTVVEGLEPGQQVVTLGSFVLKAEAVRGQAAEPH